MSTRPSVYDLLQSKGRRKWLQVHVDTAAEAAAAVEAGIAILGCAAHMRIDTATLDDVVGRAALA